MINRCEALDPTYQIIEMKEKWGEMRVISECNNEYREQIDDIEQYYQGVSATLCCKCGKPATKLSRGWILPWCDECGIDEDKYYARV